MKVELTAKKNVIPSILPQSVTPRFKLLSRAEDWFWGFRYGIVLNHVLTNVEGRL